MINYIWLFFIVSSVIISLFNNRIDDVFHAILSSCEQAVTISIGLIGIMAFWLGLMKIAEASGLLRVLAKALSPVIRFLFPDLPKNHPVQADITMNVSANALGLGNAATPFGIKAMEGLQELNQNDKKTASDAMCTFLTINTAGVQLIPVTAVAILASSKAENPTDIIVPTIITTLSALIIGVLFVKCLIKWRPEPAKRKGKS